MTQLHIDTNGELPIALEATIGEKIAILGIAGGGKSNTCAVILEEMLARNLPMTVVDIEGEYWGLKEKYDLVIIGKSPNVDIEADAANAAQFATYSVEHGVSMILDLADYDTLEDMHEFLIAYFEALWAAASKVRRPYVVVLEEAHEFIPQGANTPIKKLFTMFALRGRKRGVGMIIISQRSAKVEKSVLTQASFVFLHKVVHPTDMKVYQDILPLSSRMVEERVGALTKGDALVLVNHQAHTVRIRRRHTYHAGATPQLDSDHRQTIQRADDTVLEELQKLLVAPSEEATSEEAEGKTAAEVEKLRSDLSRKEGTINAQKAETERLKGEIARLQRENARLQAALKSTPTPSPTPSTAAQPQPVAKRPAIGPASLPSVERRNDNSLARQQRRWQSMLRDLHALPRHKKDVLLYLVEREGTSYTVEQLAKALSFAVKTLKDRPPLDVIEMGLIKRSGIPGQFRYVASVREKLAEMLPDMDAEVMIAEIIRRLR